MKVLLKTGGVAATNGWLVVDEATKQAVLFDAPDHTVGPLLRQAKESGWEIIGLWLTHGHFDHIADHAEVTKAFPNAKVLIHPLDEPKLQNPQRMLALMGLPMMIPPRKADAYVREGDELRLGSHVVRVIETPGHSPGHVMYHFPDAGLLVGGDLIIMGAVGRTDFPDSNHADLLASIRKVMKLPPETKLLPGHGDLSTLADELRDNVYVQDALEEEM